MPHCRRFNRGRAIDAIALQHREATPFERVSLSASLLNLAFGGDRAPASAASLTGPQRRAIEAIRDHGAFMIDDAHFVNYGLLMRDWGLPDSAEAVGDWLDGREAAVKAPSRKHAVVEALHGRFRDPPKVESRVGPNR
ncbi:MAG TPA: hypothetical protein VMT00_07195 [Thermoanaerobaculia bacterium]|nr:hypothetical protein [Thermoanaerobaculia bacterium]